MNALVRKEIRLLLPSWIAGLVLVSVPVWLFAGIDYSNTTPMALAGIGMLLVGLTSFGREFIAGTFPLSLAQPVPRWRIWATKTSVLAVAMALLLCVWFLSLMLVPAPVFLGNFQNNNPLDGTLLAVWALIAFSGGLWATLLLRQVAGAFWIALLVPTVIFVLGFKWVDTLPKAFLVFGIYSVGGVIWSLWLFLRAQDAQWTGGAISFSGWRRRSSGLTAVRETRTHRPLAAFFFKELQLQQTNFLVAGAFLIFQIAILFIRKAGHDDFSQSARVILEGSWALWWVMPLLLGCTAVAEERKLGTLEGTSCLPLDRRLQCAIKYGIALSLGIICGFLMPLCIDAWGMRLGLRSALHPSNIYSPTHVGLGLVCFGGLTTIAFHISTLTRNLLQALAAAVVTALSAWGLINLAMTAAYSWHYWSPDLISYITVPIIWLTLIWLAFGNYRRVEVGWKVWRGNIICILCSLAVAVTATAGTYNRAWEKFETLEPAHGPALLTGTVRPRILLTHDGIFTLLPDGRIWTNGFMWKNVFDSAIPVLKSGAFLGTNTWVELAASYDLAVGIQSDGSLWRLYSGAEIVKRFIPDPRVERIGTNSDWKNIAVNYKYFLGLKQDGTIWQGSQKFGESQVTQVGSDSDWIKIFADRDGLSLSGIKSDGSLWRWGELNAGPDWKNFKNGQKNFPEPVRRRMDSKNVVSYMNRYSFLDLAIRADGTMWATGWLPNNFWGDHLPYGLHVQPMRIGTNEIWQSVWTMFGPITALDKDGRIWVQSINNYLTIRNEAPWKLSTHRDWVAIGGEYENVLALAADGTLSCWARVGVYDPEELLAPTRRPYWSIYILQGGAPDK